MPGDVVVQGAERKREDTFLRHLILVPSSSSLLLPSPRIYLYLHLVKTSRSQVLDRDKWNFEKGLFAPHHAVKSTGSTKKSREEEREERILCKTPPLFVAIF